ncbi:MAG: hypothetical protein ACOY46_19925 [Bacillota bacterium]
MFVINLYKTIIKQWSTIIFLSGFILLILTILLENRLNHILHSTISHLSSILIGAGIVEIILQRFYVEHLVERVALSIKDQLDSSSKLNIERFYDNRNSLPAFGGELKNISEAWFAWPSGSVQGGTVLKASKDLNKGRLVLIHPDSESLKQLKQISDPYLFSVEKLREEIKILTNYAISRNIDVRWYDGLIVNSVVIANPKADYAWARLEPIINWCAPTNRPSFIVSTAKGKETFQEIFNSYIELWKSSKPPDIDVNNFSESKMT